MVCANMRLQIALGLLLVCHVPLCLAATRVALVSTSGGDAGHALLDLATVQLGNVDGIEILERTRVEHALHEYGLLKGGMVDVASVIRSTRLLGVDVFAALETVPDEKQALGIVVFDARSGVKFWDSSLPDGDIEVAVQAVREAVLTGWEKRKAIAAGKQLVTLSIGTVRNATLPTSFDSQCQSIALLLGRRLLTAPHLAMVERQHLDHVNRERELPVADTMPELLASIVTVDVDINRGDTVGYVSATALLADGEGNQSGKITVEAASENIAELADLLSAAIAKHFGTHVPAGTANREIEAMRFEREANYQVSRTAMDAALRSAEAAFALAPESYDIGLRLADILAMRVINLADRRAPLEEILSIATRTLEVIRVSRQRKQMDEASTLKDWLPEWTLIDSSFWRYVLTSLVVEGSVSEQDVAAWRRYQRDLRESVVQLLKDRSRKIKTMNEMVSFNSLLHHVLQCMEELAWNSADWTDGTIQSYDIWLTLTGPFWLREGWAVSSSRLLTRTCAQIRWPAPAYSSASRVGGWQLDNRDLTKFKDLFARFEKDELDTVVTYGKIGSLMVDFRRGQIPADQVYAHYAKVRDTIRNRCPELGEKQLKTALCQQYMAALNLIDFTLDDPADRQREYADWFEFMLEHKHMNFWVVWNMIEPATRTFRQFDPPQGGGFSHHPCEYRAVVTQRPVEDYPDMIRYRDRALAAWKTGEYLDARVLLWVMEHGSFEREIAWVMEPVLKVHPELTAREVPSPWRKTRLLFDADTHGDILALMTPILHGDRLYFTVRHKSGTHSVGYVSTSNEAPRFSPLPLSGGHSPTCISVSDDIIAVGTREHGIQLLPVTGGNSTTIDASNGLPSNEVLGVAVLGDHVYASLTGGYIIKYGITNQTFDVLVSSTRREKRSPLDDTVPRIKVTDMVPDAPRNRVLFLVAFETILECDDRYGLWQIDAATDIVSQVLPIWRTPHALRLHGADRATFEFSGGSGISAENDAPPKGLVEVDLSTNKGRLQAAWKTNIQRQFARPVGPDVKDEGDAAYLPMYASGPLLAGDGWTWATVEIQRPDVRRHYRSCRLSVDGITIDPHPPLVSAGKEFQPDWISFHRLDGERQVLATAERSIWVLELPVTD